MNRHLRQHRRRFPSALPTRNSPFPEPTRYSALRSSRRTGTRAFTLLEVVLALSLALGLLGVVLVFYQQIAHVRDQALADTAGLAAVRLCMDRLATELRTVSPQPDGFRGGPQEIEFVRCHLNATWSTATSTHPAARRPDAFPLRRIRYRLAGTNDLGTPTGVERLEEAAGSTLPPAASPMADPAPSATSPSTNAEPALADATAPTNAVAEVLTEAVVGTAEGSTESSGTASARLDLPALHYLAFRYWDGATWVTSWTGPGLPRGVEISLATEAAPATAGPDALPTEVFRRLVALPLASATPGSTSPVRDGPDATRRLIPEDAGL